MAKAKWIVEQVKGLSDEDKAEVLAAAMEVASTPEEESGLVSLADFTEAAQERYRLFGKMQGLSSGYAGVDQLTKGLVGGELVVIAGKTSRGKTTLALNIANNVALKDVPVLFVTLEMTPVEITSRYMAINGGETDDYYKVAGLTVLQERDELNWKSIDALIGHAKRDLDVGLIVIDHLHYFTRATQNVAEDLGNITKEFKKNAIRHDVPVLLISHVRKTERGGEATMEDLRGSSYVAQDADIVLMVERDKDDPEWLCVKIEKNRSRGYDFQNNVVKLYFDKVKLLESKPVHNPFTGD